jgi:non-specific serine/threonine protein kinase
LRSLIDWSYDLLGDPAKRLLQRLSVFAGGWRLEAAESVCAGDGIDGAGGFDLLASLVDKSLVVVDARDKGSRFRLAETMRQYAREKLLEHGDGEAVRERHCKHFVALAAEAEPMLVGPEQAAWLGRLEEEYDNLRSALEWSLAAEGGRALRLCGCLQRFWIAHGHHGEGREWCARALAADGAEASTPDRAKTLNCAGLLAYHQHDHVAARALLEQSLALRRAAGDRRGIAIALVNLGMVALGQDDLASARALHEESLAIARELGNRNGIARSLGNLGMVASAQRDFAAARLMFQECLAIMRELGDHEGIAIALHSLGDAAYELGDLAASGAYYADSLAILQALGHRPRIAYSLAGLAVVATAQGDALLGARLWGAAERLGEDMGMPPPVDNAAYATHVASARTALDDSEAFDRAWHEGRTLGAEQVFGLVRECFGSGTALERQELRRA